MAYDSKFYSLVSVRSLHNFYTFAEKVTLELKIIIGVGIIGFVRNNVAGTLASLIYFSLDETDPQTRAQALSSSRPTYIPSSPSAPTIHCTICCSCSCGMPSESASF